MTNPNERLVVSVPQDEYIQLVAARLVLDVINKSISVLNNEKRRSVASTSASQSDRNCSTTQITALGRSNGVQIDRSPKNEYQIELSFQAYVRHMVYQVNQHHIYY